MAFPAAFIFAFPLPFTGLPTAVLFVFFTAYPCAFFSAYPCTFHCIPVALSTASSWPFSLPSLALLHRIPFALPTASQVLRQELEFAEQQERTAVRLAEIAALVEVNEQLNRNPRRLGPSCLKTVHVYENIVLVQVAAAPSGKAGGLKQCLSSPGRPRADGGDGLRHCDRAVRYADSPCSKYEIPS